MAAQSTNLPQIDIDETLRYFRDFYDADVSVTQNVHDALFAFFIDRTENKDAADALVNAVIITSLVTKTNPMAVLDSFRKLNTELTLDIQMAAFLNLSRDITSALGVVNTPKVNKHIERTILG